MHSNSLTHHNDPRTRQAHSLGTRSTSPNPTHTWCLQYRCTVTSVITIIINRQFLMRRNIEHHHPLQGRELSMYREIQ